MKMFSFLSLKKNKTVEQRRRRRRRQRQGELSVWTICWKDNENSRGAIRRNNAPLVAAQVLIISIISSSILNARLLLVAKIFILVSLSSARDIAIDADEKAESFLLRLFPQKWL